MFEEKLSIYNKDENELKDVECFYELEGAEDTLTVKEFVQWKYLMKKKLYMR